MFCLQKTAKIEKSSERDAIEELEELLSGYNPEIVAAVLAKRAENNAVAPKEKPKKDKIAQIFDDDQ